MTLYMTDCKVVIFAWGADKMATEKGRALMNVYKYGSVLGLNKDGSPKHPLYLPGTAQPSRLQQQPTSEGAFNLKHAHLGAP